MSALRDMFISGGRAGLRQSGRLRLAALVCTALWLALFLGLNVMRGNSEKQSMSHAARLNKITPLVRELEGLGAERDNSFSGIGPQAAAQKVTRELGLEDRLASLRPSQLVGGQEGVQLLYESLDLNQLIRLLEQLKSKGGLSVLSVVVNHRLDQPERADLQLVLSQ